MVLRYKLIVLFLITSKFYIRVAVIKACKTAIA